MDLIKSLQIRSDICLLVFDARDATKCLYVNRLSANSKSKGLGDKCFQSRRIWKMQAKPFISSSQP